MSIDLILGTRPEVTKAATVIRELGVRCRSRPRILFTGQQTTLVVQTHEALELGKFAEIVWLGDPLQVGTDKSWRHRLSPLLSTVFWLNEKPSLVATVGDTDSATLGVEVATALNVRVAHLEAGIRHTRSQYFIEPEEKNRRHISKLATFHLAPFLEQRDNLLKEGISADAIRICGDLSICAVTHALTDLRRLIANEELDPPSPLDANDEYIICTFHRSTSLLFQEDLVQRLVETVRFFGRKKFVLVTRTDTRWEPFVRILSSLENVTVFPALDPTIMGYAIAFSHFVITDSAGVQQEALALGKQVVACREDVELYQNNPLLQVVRPPFRRLLPVVAQISDAGSVSCPPSECRKIIETGNSTAESYALALIEFANDAQRSSDELTPS
ncbi:MAG TPA: UDP-N-acetylglucosamine 2-epimerase [Pyrinomonadaceae bacterium]|nr:UDP-N-acetylglucosamine 2-epimerase [Pyrinomonadaceae bacterium]